MVAVPRLLSRGLGMWNRHYFVFQYCCSGEQYHTARSHRPNAYRSRPAGASSVPGTDLTARAERSPPTYASTFSAFISMGLPSGNPTRTSTASGSSCSSDAWAASSTIARWVAERFFTEWLHSSTGTPTSTTWLLSSTSIAASAAQLFWPSERNAGRPQLASGKYLCFASFD